MNIRDLFDERMIIDNLTSTTKNAAIHEMVDVLAERGRLHDKELYLKSVFERESKFSTGIGMGVAIPHGKSKGVKKTSLVFARSSHGIKYDSLDGKPVHLLFLLAVPEEATDEHLKVLAMLSAKLMHQNVRESLMKDASYENIIALLNAS